jgi:hypothetical protein
MKKELLLMALIISTSCFCQSALLNSSTPITPYLTVNSPVGEEIAKIIDGDINTKFSDTNIADGIGFQVNLSSNPTIATRIDVTVSNNIPNRDPQNFQLSGSNDGSSYTSIYIGTITCGLSRNTVVNFPFSNTISYTYYRVNFTNLCGNQSAFQLAEVQLFGTSLGIEDNAILSGINFFPNPAKDILIIENERKSTLNKIIISDITGKELANFELNNTKEAQQLNLSNFTKGIYVMKIFSQSGVLTKKLIVD